MERRFAETDAGGREDEGAGVRREALVAPAEMEANSDLRRPPLGMAAVPAGRALLAERGSAAAAGVGKQEGRASDCPFDIMRFRLIYLSISRPAVVWAESIK